MINFTSKPRYALDDLIRLVHALRAPGGCPWDAAQTHLSIRRNFLEEAYEACEALDCDDAAMLREELGDVLLQVLDDGRLTDGQGRTVDFKNTIIILTSNLGSQYLLDGIDENGNISEEAREGVMNELRRSFRPEFLNRLDETIFFRPLTKDNLKGIIDIMLDSLKKRLADKSLGLEVTDAAKELIIDRGFDPVYGARPLRRYLQSSLETLVARKILSGDLDADSTITVDVENGELVCK